MTDQYTDQEVGDIGRLTAGAIFAQHRDDEAGVRTLLETATPKQLRLVIRMLTGLVLNEWALQGVPVERVLAFMIRKIVEGDYDLPKG